MATRARTVTGTTRQHLLETSADLQALLLAGNECALRRAPDPLKNTTPLIAEEDIAESGSECTGAEAQDAERVGVTRSNAWQGIQVRVYSRTSNSWGKGTIEAVTNFGVNVHFIARQTASRCLCQGT